MDQKNKKMNEYIEDSRNLINVTIKDKSYDSQFKDMCVLTSAIMMSYYKKKDVDVFPKLFSLFENTNFVLTHEKLSSLLDENYLGMSNEKIVNMKIPSLLLRSVKDRRLFAKLDAQGLKTEIYLSDCNVKNDLEYFISFVHEVNHQLNALSNPMFIKNGEFFLRQGLEAFDIYTAEKKASSLEEGINVLQTSEIVREVFPFSKDKIEDTGVRNLVSSLQQYKDQNVQLGYQKILPFVKELYQDDYFQYCAFEERLLGKVGLLEYEFDYYLFPGAYQILWKNLNTHLTTNQKEIYLQTKQSTNTIVKTYLKKRGK